MIAGRKPHPFLLPKGLALRVSAGDDSHGTLKLLAGRPTYAPIGEFEIKPGVIFFGPYETPAQGTLTADTGHIEFTFTSDFEAKVDRATTVVKSHRVIAEALNERAALLKEKQMSIAEKARMVADKARAVPTVLGARFDQSLTRLDDAEKRGNAAQDRIDAVVKDIETGVAAIEDTANQLSNGAPLEPSAAS